MRATFDVMAGGQLRLADEQPPPLLEPEYHGPAGESALRLDSDLLAQKPGTDIVLDAHAHSPGGKPATAVEASLLLPGLSKTLIVYGPRVYRRGVGGVAMSSPAPFVTQPIRYEWAFGGSDLTNPDATKRFIDHRNPIGKGRAADPADLLDRPAHVIEYPGANASSAGPAGFGPVSSFWSPRRERAGTYDETWERSKKPLLPDDYDASFALSAPDDQRPKAPLRGGEPVLLVNMTSEGNLRFDLPKIALHFETHFRLRSVRHAAALSTVSIVPHARKVSLIWQSALKVPALETDYLDYTHIAEGPPA